MDERQAFEVLVQALEGANKGQRFSLKDSATIFAALNILATKLGISTEPQPEEEPEVEVEKKKK